MSLVPILIILSPLQL